jgi:uncharacterized protein YggU (UPF0235/DUF167 family)
MDADRSSRSRGGKIQLRVKVTSRAGRDALEGIEHRGAGPVVKIRVPVPAENGSARKAARGLVRSLLGRPASAVVLQRGATARTKVLRVEGTDVQAVDRALGEGASRR